MFHSKFNIGRSDLRMVARNFYRHMVHMYALESVASFRKKMGENTFFLRKRLIIFGLFDGLCSVRTRFRHYYGGTYESGPHMVCKNGGIYGFLGAWWVLILNSANPRS